MTAALLDEPMNHRQSESRTFARLFGGEERLENPGLGLLVHAAAVVTDQDSQMACGVFNFHDNLGGAGVPKRIGQSFASNEINFVVNEEPELPRRTFHDDAKFALRGDGEVFLNAGKCFFQALANYFG